MNLNASPLNSQWHLRVRVRFLLLMHCYMERYKQCEQLPVIDWTKR